jgi:hypothetical protein
LTAVLVASVTILAFPAAWLSVWMFHNPAATIFNGIAVGDTELKLVNTLQNHGINYYASPHQGKLVYSHSDGLFGVCFYYVENGRIVKKASD